MCYFRSREYWISSPLPPPKPSPYLKLDLLRPAPSAQFWCDASLLESTLVKNRGVGVLWSTRLLARESVLSSIATPESLFHESPITSRESPCSGIVASSCFSPG